MKVAIAGSRSCGKVGDNQWDYPFLIEEISRVVRENDLDVTTVISGNAGGPDRAGELWATLHNAEINQMKPSWNKGRGAGFINNTEMAKECDCLIVIYDGKSKGTKHMIDQVTKMGKHVYNLERTY